MTTEQNEIKSAEWRKKNLSKNGVLADVIKSACVLRLCAVWEIEKQMLNYAEKFI